MEADIGSTAPYPINLIFVNPDHLHEALDKIGAHRREGKYAIGCWFWELEQIPDEWLWALDEFDEFLVASTFVERALRRVTDKPITLVSLPIFHQIDHGVSRSEFGLPSDKYLFLTTFDFHSSIHRKNPHAVVEAFQSAFPPGRNDVNLLIKSTNGHQYPERLHQLLSYCINDSRIIIKDQLLQRVDVHALQLCADAYISLHRAEGFGLGMAECMALGKPVIGTGWSGNTDFMSAGNSCLVRFTLVAVKPGEYPHKEGSLWAEPDIGHAAQLMNKMAGDVVASATLGQRAAADVARKLSPALLASKLILRFNDLLDNPHRVAASGDSSNQ
ncbi:MAG: glycosyltransferase [Pseudomonas sp.]